MTDDNDGDIDTDVTVGVLSTLKQNERKKKLKFWNGWILLSFFFFSNIAI